MHHASGPAEQPPSTTLSVDVPGQKNCPLANEKSDGESDYLSKEYPLPMHTQSSHT